MSEFGAIIHDECLNFLSVKPNFKVEFVRRQANIIVHMLARVATSFASHHFFSDVPDCIVHDIELEMK